MSLLKENRAVISRGRPKVYSDASLLVFYAAMTLKQINKIRGQHRWTRIDNARDAATTIFSHATLASDTKH